MFHRKVIKVTAEQSPNVRFARWQLEQGKQPTDEVLVDGVLTWGEYQTRRATWDKLRQTVGLDAEFYEGPEIKLWPLEWLLRAEARAIELKGKTRKGRALGCDPAEGGDHTVWAVVDELGLLELVSLKTSDTSIICGMTIALGSKWGVEPENWVFDRGGGGKQHADNLRRDHDSKIRTIAFGETILPTIKRSKRLFGEKLEVREDKQTYFNRRAEMYGEASSLFDPGQNPDGFALPIQEHVAPGRKSLREQLEMIPKEYDKEGRLKVRSKQRDPGVEEAKHKTLIELIGHSPDEADAFVLACHGMLHKAPRLTAGAA